MKALYVGALWEGGTCQERKKMLEERGWDVVGFDTTRYLRGDYRIFQSLQHRLKAGPSVWRLNKELLEYSSSLESVDIVWIDKGLWIKKSTIVALKNTLNSKLVHYTPDPAFQIHTSRHFRQSLPVYDFCITTKKYELELYSKYGAREAIFSLQGVDERFLNCDICGDIKSTERSGVVFIGHWEKSYAEIFEQLEYDQYGLSIYGPGWGRFRNSGQSFSNSIIGDGVWREEYAQTLGRAKISLGLLSKLYPDQFTTRTFEIPASGTLMIAERTAEHLELFDEGKEAEFYSTIEELNDKIDFYLNNDSARETIAKTGRERVLREYTWSAVLETTVSRIEKSMNNTLGVVD